MEPVKSDGSVLDLIHARLDRFCQVLVVNARDRIPLLVVTLSVVVLFLIPLKIIGYGYLPEDDALRHAAKAVAGKPWREILVLDPVFKVDVHEGWHATLGAVHRLTGINAESLAVLSVVVMALVFLVPAAFRRSRPEAWVAALLLMIVALPAYTVRIMTGRPYLVQVAMILLICATWQHFRAPAKNKRYLGFFIILVALSVWMRSTWYLYSIPAFALVLAREWKATIVFTTAVGIGSILGGLATGTPLLFLSQGIIFMVHAALRDVEADIMVGEMQPFAGYAGTLLALAAVALWGRLNGKLSGRAFDTPVFYLMLVTWMLGFVAAKFWLEFGFPAALIWLQTRFSDQLDGHPAMDYDKAPRLALSAFLCVALFLAVTSDHDGRWTNTLRREYLDMNNPDHRPWLPDQGGILYSSSMRLFFNTFLANPNGEWRYMLGFEPGLMPKEDQTIYHRIVLNGFASEAYQPWVDKMRPEDRLILRRRHNNPPTIPELEWDYTIDNHWCGRLPRRESDENAASRNEQ
ncbi:MAG: hypothetical protein K9N51_07535 [Candidatus Pacebacteria bacterium]|nr:hypothetical protein [Candidatus Paceibacterota bacterium]